MNAPATTKPLITVAMVTYNSAATIDLAIESVLCSSYDRFELLIADDCSTDNTWQIIGSYKDPRIRAIRNTTNLGEYPNRDQCARLATGDYLIFIDGDDLAYPHGLEFMIRMLEAFPDCGMALMYGYDERVILPAVLSPRDYYLNFYCGTGLLDVAFTNTLFRKAALERIGGIPVEYCTGDDYTRLKVAAHYNTLIISDQLTWWRMTPNQASQRVRSDRRLAMTEMIDLANAVLTSPDCPLTPAEQQMARKNLAFKLKMEVRRSCRRLRLAEALQLFRLAQRIPFPSFGLLGARQDPSLDPFRDHNGSNPYRIDLSKNPFSTTYKGMP